MNTYIAFLRGINVGGYHKVPMTDLKKEFLKLGLVNIETLLNSGNVIFEAITEDISTLEKTLSDHLEKVFGFPVPTILRTSETINELLAADPFKNETLSKDMRFYVSFLQKEDNGNLKLPWTSDDNSFRIIGKIDRAIISVLDLSISKTPKAMNVFEKFYGKDVTTRNWKTIERIKTKLEDKR